MEIYDKLLNDVIAHIRQSHASTQTAQLRAGGSRDFVLPTTSETPTSASDFDLVTWMAVIEPQ